MSFRVNVDKQCEFILLCLFSFLLLSVVVDISHHHRLPGSVIAAIAGAVAVFLLIVGVLVAFFLDR